MKPRYSLLNNIIASPLALHYRGSTAGADQQCPVSGLKKLTFDLEQLGNLSFPIKIWCLALLFFTGSDRAMDSLQFFLEYNLRLVMLPARVEHWQQGPGMTRRKPMVKIYFENNYSVPANSNTLCMSFMPWDLFLDLDFTHRQGQFFTPDKQIRMNCSLTHD